MAESFINVLRAKERFPQASQLFLVEMTLQSCLLPWGWECGNEGFLVAIWGCVSWRCSAACQLPPSALRLHLLLLALPKWLQKFVFAQLAGLQRSGKALQLGPVVCSRMSDILQHDLLLPHIWYRHCTDLFWLRSSDFAWVWCQNCLAEEVPDCWIAFLGLHPAPL